jgi:hypothetical protein
MICATPWFREQEAALVGDTPGGENHFVKGAEKLWATTTACRSRHAPSARVLRASEILRRAYGATVRPMRNLIRIRIILASAVRVVSDAAKEEEEILPGGMIAAGGGGLRSWPGGFFGQG